MHAVQAEHQHQLHLSNCPRINQKGRTIMSQPARKPKRCSPASATFGAYQPLSRASASVRFDSAARWISVVPPDTIRSPCNAEASQCDPASERRLQCCP